MTFFLGSKCFVGKVCWVTFVSDSAQHHMTPPPTLALYCRCVVFLQGAAQDTELRQLVPR